MVRLWSEAENPKKWKLFKSSSPSLKAENSDDGSSFDEADF